MFAAGYDRFMAGTERELGPMRRELLAETSGRVVEIGAGTGVNLQHYPPAVEEIVCVEPEEPMARRLRRKLTDSGRRGVEVVHAPAEALPFEDDSFDYAVATLVLCTVQDPERALGEIARVLRPGGRLLFLEHVRSDDPKVAKWQDRLHPLWLRFGHGCNCNRPTLATIEASRLRVERHAEGRMPKAPAIVRPLLTGTAVAE